MDIKSFLEKKFVVGIEGITATGERWWECFYDGVMIFQVSQNMKVSDFISNISELKNDKSISTFDNMDGWISIPDENIDLVYDLISNT